MCSNRTKNEKKNGCKEIRGTLSFQKTTTNENHFWKVASVLKKRGRCNRLLFCCPPAVVLVSFSCPRAVQGWMSKPIAKLVRRVRVWTLPLKRGWMWALPHSEREEDDWIMLPPELYELLQGWLAHRDRAREASGNVKTVESTVFALFCISRLWENDTF